MPTYLKHNATGDLYIYTDAMAKRGDMTVVDEADIGPKEEKAPAPPKKKAAPRKRAENKVPAKEPAPKPASEPESDGSDEDDDAGADLSGLFGDGEE